jgi:predicted nucleic-acid-binding Zn-ribbon protein
VRNGKCPKCGSHDVLGDRAVTLSESDGSPVYIQCDGPAGWFGVPRPVLAAVRAWVCRRCEYTEFYTPDAQNLPTGPLDAGPDVAK